MSTKSSLIGRFKAVDSTLLALDTSGRKTLLCLWSDRILNYPLFVELNDPLRQIFKPDDLRFIEILDRFIELWRMDYPTLDGSSFGMIEELNEYLSDEFFIINQHYRHTVLARVVSNNVGELSNAIGENFSQNILDLMIGMASSGTSAANASISQQPSDEVHNSIRESGETLAEWLRVNNPGIDRLFDLIVEDVWLAENPNHRRMLAGSRGRVLAVAQAFQYHQVCTWMRELPERGNGDPHSWWDEVIAKVTNQPDLVDWMLGWPNRDPY